MDGSLDDYAGKKRVGGDNNNSDNNGRTQRFYNRTERYNNRAPYDNQNGGKNWSPRGGNNNYGNGGKNWNNNKGKDGKGNGKKGKRSVPVSKRACQKTTIYFEENGDMHVKLYDTSVVVFRKMAEEEERAIKEEKAKDEKKEEPNSSATEEDVSKKEEKEEDEEKKEANGSVVIEEGDEKKVVEEDAPAKEGEKEEQKEVALSAKGLCAEVVLNSGGFLTNETRFVMNEALSFCDMTVRYRDRSVDELIKAKTKEERMSSASAARISTRSDAGRESRAVSEVAEEEVLRRVSTRDEDVEVEGADEKVVIEEDEDDLDFGGEDDDERPSKKRKVIEETEEKKEEANGSKESAESDKKNMLQNLLAAKRKSTSKKSRKSTASAGSRKDQLLDSVLAEPKKREFDSREKFGEWVVTGKFADEEGNSVKNFTDCMVLMVCDFLDLETIAAKLRGKVSEHATKRIENNESGKGNQQYNNNFGGKGNNQQNYNNPLGYGVPTNNNYGNQSQWGQQSQQQWGGQQGYGNNDWNQGGYGQPPILPLPHDTQQSLQTFDTSYGSASGSNDWNQDNSWSNNSQQQSGSSPRSMEHSKIWKPPSLIDGAALSSNSSGGRNNSGRSRYDSAPPQQDTAALAKQLGLPPGTNIVVVQGPPPASNAPVMNIGSNGGMQLPPGLTLQPVGGGAPAGGIINLGNIAPGNLPAGMVMKPVSGADKDAWNADEGDKKRHNRNRKRRRGDDDKNAGESGQKRRSGGGSSDAPMIFQ